jgi:hypothetical protein
MTWRCPRGLYGGAWSGKSRKECGSVVQVGVEDAQIEEI